MVKQQTDNVGEKRKDGKDNGINVTSDMRRVAPSGKHSRNHSRDIRKRAARDGEGVCNTLTREQRRAHVDNLIIPNTMEAWGR
eukprot:XP_001704938.1 Hypothetical protein GL50803_38249 [Giardia lamblia ATCC 50803]